jgi:serine/threonine protein kinase
LTNTDKKYIVTLKNEIIYDTFFQESTMYEFNRGMKIPLINGAVAEIVERLGSGGQGIVYKVLVNGSPYALKWYNASKLVNKKAFQKNIQANIDMGSPDARFLWPLSLTREGGGSFGYIMPLRPQGFSEFYDVLLNKVQFASMDTMFAAAMNIVAAFRALHRKGLSYQDLNDGNFFLNVSTGDVLVCDNDNCTPADQENSGRIGGKPGFMAPEIVRSEAHPSSLTDYYSLGVILFLLFFRNDPLMGLAYVQSVGITPERELELYGTKPVFIFDPHNASNRPVPGIHTAPLKLWSLFPEFFRAAFVKSFCDGMRNPDVRLPENEWLKLLVKLRDEFISCPSCGLTLPVEKFSSQGQILCGKCGGRFNFPLRFVIHNKYAVPLFPGKTIYACHVKNTDDWFTVAAKVLNQKFRDRWVIKNLSGESWFVSPAGGAGKNFDTGSAVPVVEDVTISFSQNSAGKIIAGNAKF